MHSMVKNHLPSCSNSSPRLTRLRWLMRCSERNSFLKRSNETPSRCNSVFNATRVSVSRSKASYTAPMPPAPRQRRISKRGVPSNIGTARDGSRWAGMDRCNWNHIPAGEPPSTTAFEHDRPCARGAPDIPHGGAVPGAVSDERPLHHLSDTFHQPRHQRNRMRYLIPIVVLIAIVLGLGMVKFKQISNLLHAGELAQKAGPPPEVVSTSVARAETWEGTLSAVGSVTAVRGVAVSNEAPGVVTAIHFESGQKVRAGQVLVELDTSVERAQLASAEARKELAAVGMGRSRQLATRNAISKAQLDGDEAQVKTSSADFGALQAQIERKSVRAPFAGRLGIRTVNLGQY